MNNDRELLELAARAAGLEIDSFIFQGDRLVFAVLEDDINGDDWNPLTDDGDALRLAVKLGLTVYTRFESQRDDWEEATRRAITRAAAEIGKAMV